jgi:hypothetical protein
VTAAHLVGEDPDPLAAPEGWTPEKSLSRQHEYILNEDVPKKLRFLRRDAGVDVYRDNASGKEVFIGRTSGN